MENIREQIEREFREREEDSIETERIFRKSDPNYTRPDELELFVGYFNNFCELLPGASRRNRVLTNGNLDELDEVCGNGSIHAISERRARMTPREFYQDVDNAITEIGLDLNELERLYTFTNAENGKERFEGFRNLYQYTSSLYEILRERGYSKRDLTS